MSESPFFTLLPAEVRDMIYDYLWSDTRAIIQRYQDQAYTVTYDRRHDSLEAPSSSDKVPWLLTNRQMMHEGTRQLHQKSTWHVRNGIITDFRPDYVFDPIVPSRCHTHEIFVQGEWPIFWERVYRRTRLPRDEVLEGPATANPSSTPLDTICIKLFRPAHEWLHAYLAPDIAFDLSGLDKLSSHAHLRHFQVHLAGRVDDAVKLVSYWRLPQWRWDSVAKARRLEDSYWESWEKEISRLGQLVIPGSKRTGYLSDFTRESDGLRYFEWVWTFERR